MTEHRVQVVGIGRWSVEYNGARIGEFANPKAVGAAKGVSATAREGFLCSRTRDAPPRRAAEGCAFPHAASRRNLLVEPIFNASNLLFPGEGFGCVCNV